MPKKLNYASYSLVSGISQGKDEQIFETLDLTECDNFRYFKQDSLLASLNFVNRGQGKVGKRLPTDKIVGLKRFKNTILALTHKEIYRLDITKNPVNNLYKTMNLTRLAIILMPIWIPYL